MKFLQISLIFFLATLIGNVANGQGFYDLGSIQKIEVSFTESNWDALMDAQKSGNEDYIMAKEVTINGVTYDSVGVKYKGNSSYRANQVKNPWHIELDTYKDQEYEGYTDIKLSNGYNDPSFLRDVLAYQILRQYMDAPLANYANLYVNGTLIGLYSNVESISKKFVKSRFGSKNNTFVKCSPPDGAGPQSTDLPTLEYLGTDSTVYYDAYELKSDAGWNELIDLTDTLSNNINYIEEILDVDRALWMLAFDNAIVNLDSYIGAFSQNYYLYRDDNQRFLPVVWDLNESFGVFSMTGTGTLGNNTSKQQMDHLLHDADLSYPLVRKLLAIPMYKRMYLAHYKTILLENFDNDSYLTKGQTLQAVIDTAVQDDPNKFYTYANFTSNLNSDVTSGGGGGPGGPGGPGGSSIPGIKSIMDARSAYLLGLSDFTQSTPSISNISTSVSEPNIGDTVMVTATISNEVDVYIGYRSHTNGRFTRVKMLDDGQHNDGAANDGVYGAEVVMASAKIQYYIYAENSNAGIFSPQRAEYEYHVIEANTISGDVVINEVLASNGDVEADQNGEYDDWIELYNNSNEAIDISGYYLSDDLGDLLQWEIPAGTVINANDYLIIWADKDEGQDGLHANFKISASGESVVFSDSLGNIMDQVSFTSQRENKSYGRYPNGTGEFQQMTPTFGSENQEPSSVAESPLDLEPMRAFPNPADEYFTLVLNKEGEKDVLVFNTSGHLIFEVTANEVAYIPTANWVPGLYIVKVDNELLKVIVQ